MKKFLFLISIVLFVKNNAQSKIFVKNTEGNPVANANVTCNKKNLGNTDSQGTLQFKTRCKKVTINAKGYYEDDVVVDKVMEATLSHRDPKTQDIETVVIADKSDPRALAILKKVDENYKNNSPQSLDSYSYKSYEKISLDLDEDSVKAYNKFLDKRIDSLKALPVKQMSEKKKKDSTESANVMKLMTQSKLFLWERAQEFLWSKKFGEKTLVLDNRVSGLKQPLYEMMTLRSNRNKMPREIREENRGLYRFFLSDTIEIEGRKNFVIRFRQVDYKQPVNRRKFNGYLYIDTETYALKKIESNSKIKSEGNITSIWKPIENKWFLYRENLKIRMGATVFDTKKPDEKDKNSEKNSDKNRKKFGNYVFMVTDYFDFKTPIKVRQKDFAGYTIEVQNSDGKLIKNFRTDTLSKREQMTYAKIDSVGKKYKLDRKANIVTGLMRGKIRIGNVDFDAGNAFKYNMYEGFRTSLGFKLNENFNRYISPDAYIAYGFKDKAIKFGAGIDIRTTLKKNSFFRMEYSDDVVAAGRFNENLWSFRMSYMNSEIDVYNDHFYHFKTYKLSYEKDLLNSLTLKISAKKENSEAKFPYNFQNLGSAFNNFSFITTIKYSPNSKNIMTPSGKYTYEQNFPELYLNYEQGLKTFDGDFNFSRIDALFLHNFKTKIGVTGLRVYGGILSGDAPIWNNFTMNGLGSGKNELNYNFASYIGFATMESRKYYNDKFVGTYLTHKIPWYFKSFGKNTSSFDLVYRGVIGNMQHPEYHQFDFQKLDHLYQEAGFEWNNFLSSQFNLGLFYRFGYYATPNFKENFAIQLKFKVLGF